MSTTWFDLIRHGEPEGGPRYRGHRDDPLSARGWAQMRAAVTTEDRWDRIITSPLQRCQAFARELADRHRLPLQLEPDFMEIHLGDWEGHPHATVLAEDGERLQAFWMGRIPAPGGEDLGRFRQRLQRGWQHWTREAAGERVLLVCHSGVIRVLVGDLLGLAPELALARLMVPHACRSRIRLDQTDHGLLGCLVGHGMVTGEVEP